MFRFFFEFSKWIYKEYEGLFNIEDDDNEEDSEDEFEQDVSFTRWGWLGTIFELCDNQIFRIDEVTQRPILEVLNWLSYHKEKINIINEKNKRQ